MERKKIDDLEALLPVMEFFPGMSVLDIQAHLENDFKNSALIEGRSKITIDEKTEIRQFLLMKNTKDRINLILGILEKPQLTDFDRLKLTIFFDLLVANIKTNYLPYLK